MRDLTKFQDFGEVWQEFYEELCVLKCQVYGIAKEDLPERLEFGLNVQVDRLFTLHDQIFESVTALCRRAERH